MNWELTYDSANVFGIPIDVDARIKRGQLQLTHQPFISVLVQFAKVVLSTRVLNGNFLQEFMLSVFIQIDIKQGQGFQEGVFLGDTEVRVLQDSKQNVSLRVREAFLQDVQPCYEVLYKDVLVIG